MAIYHCSPYLTNCIPRGLRQTIALLVSKHLHKRNLLSNNFQGAIIKILHKMSMSGFVNVIEFALAIYGY